MPVYVQAERGGPFVLSQTRPDKHLPRAGVGPFRLITRVASSQDFEIWEASREPLGSRHALKVMLPGRHGNRRAIALLRREFRVAGRLRHPNIIRVDEFG